MKAGKLFGETLVTQQLLEKTNRVTVDVYGSLSLTGRGHHTDIAIILGLTGVSPEDVEIDTIPMIIADVQQRQRLLMNHGSHEVEFARDGGMVFHAENLPLHENGLTLTAWHNQLQLLQQTYYSVGGGFIVEADDFGISTLNEVTVPYAFSSAKALLQHCENTQLSLGALVLENEIALHGREAVDDYFANIWATMQACIDRGLNTEGVLPGPLRVPRRAAALRRLLITGGLNPDDPLNTLDWINMFALAVNEENAAGGRVVTAPTNGACGIIPAVLSYYDKFITPVTHDVALRYFLASGAIGILYKLNASISGAEVGCQGEVGVACSMAAAGLAELLGGTPLQVCVAAEIGMEHNLGLTCDPVAGQVQVPCIERNAIASVKAINAARMAIRRTSEARVSLDKVIETMYETGKDMNAKYRETSRGGLAIKVQCD